MRKNKSIVYLLLLFVFGLSLFVSCQKQMVTVRFYDDEKLLKTSEIESGSCVDEYTPPEKENYEFKGWFDSKEFTNEFDFKKEITEDTNLYAKYLEITKPEPEDSITLSADGKNVIYKEDGKEIKITLNEKNFFINGRLNETESSFPYVYKSFNEALDDATNGTEDEPMNLYIAPYVYWIHDPNSESTTEPFGIIKEIENLHITGLSKNPNDIVIAANYGHDEGFAGGNWTMFKITGDGLTLKNVTFGNYCNIDLVYELDQSLNVKKRTDNITQGQIGSYSGDKLYAENCNFISRLNMMPFNNSERALYVNCHMECTDDSLNGSAKSVYLNCDFDFYASKPWGGSAGSTLLNCTMNMKHINIPTDKPVEQYLSKMQGNFRLIDCEFKSTYGENVVIGFNDVLQNTFRSFYSNVTYNGEQIKMDNMGKNPNAGVDISNTDALKAYKLEIGNNTIYNVYNLLRGNDDWDPLNQKEIITSATADNLPYTMEAYIDSPFGNLKSTTIETGKEGVKLFVDLIGDQETEYEKDVQITWEVLEPNANLVRIVPNGTTCDVIGNNDTDEIVNLIIVARTNTGFEAAVEIIVKPSVLPAPTFTKAPTISISENYATVNYELDLDGHVDDSNVSWYVCDNLNGENPICIANSNTGEILKSIPLNKAYNGKFLKVVVLPKSTRSEYGEKMEYIFGTPINTENIPEEKIIDFDLTTLSLKNQSQIIPGLFTLDFYKPLDTIEQGSEWYSNKNISEGQAWAYGTGNKNGFLGYTGIYQNNYGARMMYTAIDNQYHDMSLTLKLAPGKTAGQGFGSANQYMDIMIKYDTKSLTGYGVRIYRISGDSCGVALVKHENGQSEIISERIETSAYLTECSVNVYLNGNTLGVVLETTAEQPQTAIDKGYVHNVKLEQNIATSSFGGFAIFHAGTTGDNSTYIGKITLEYK